MGQTLPNDAIYLISRNDTTLARLVLEAEIFYVSLRPPYITHPRLPLGIALKCRAATFLLSCWLGQSTTFFLHEIKCFVLGTTTRSFLFFFFFFFLELRRCERTEILIGWLRKHAKPSPRSHVLERTAVMYHLRPAAASAPAATCSITGRQSGIRLFLGWLWFQRPISLRLVKGMKIHRSTYKWACVTRYEIDRLPGRQTAELQDLLTFIFRVYSYWHRSWGFLFLFLSNPGSWRLLCLCRAFHFRILFCPLILPLSVCCRLTIPRVLQNHPVNKIFD